MDPLRTPDTTIYLYWLIEGITDPMVCVGTASNLYGAGTMRPVVQPRSLACDYGRVEPFRGLGTPGHLSLDVVDVGGWLSGLLADGAETYLTADVEPGAVTISTEDASVLPASGKVYIHRAAYTYSGTSGDDLTGVVRVGDHLGEYAPPHRIVSGLGMEQDGYTSRVRVATTPQYLEGRYLSMHAISLDPGGYPVVDGSGRSDFEVWRGVITSCAMAPDGRGYSIQADTLDRLIQEDPPQSGIAGKLATGAWVPAPDGGGSDWGITQTPLFISQRRRMVDVYVRCTSSDCEVDAWGGVNVLTQQDHGEYVLLSQIGSAVRSVILAFLDALDPEDVSIGFAVTPADPEVPAKMNLTYQIRNWPYEQGTLTIGVGGGIWEQLGFAGTHYHMGDAPDPITLLTGGYLPAAEFPAPIYIRPEDTEIPVVINTPETITAGWVDVAGELTYFGAVDTSQVVDGRPCHILYECLRGYAGTVALTHVYRLSDDPTDAPEVRAAYCVGGGAVLGADAPDPSLWYGLLKALTGTGDDGNNGSWKAWPGLGLPKEHLDTAAITALMQEEPTTGPVYGAVTSLRAFLSDALALEGYALVTRPLADGTCRLSPVRLGAVSTGETLTAVDIDASQGVTTQGGLGDVINRVTVKGPRSEANYTDADSVARFGVRQREEYGLPVPDVAGVLAVAAAVKRIFAIAGSHRYLRADVSIAPTRRMVAPGDVLALVFPAASLSGAWRVLGASTQLRGSGSVRVSVMRIGAWSTVMYAPATEIAAINGGDLTVTAGDAAWFKTGAKVWVYDPDDYTDGVEGTIATIPDADTIQVADATGMTAGDWVEYLDEPGADDDRYAWLTDPATASWGD